MLIRTKLKAVAHSHMSWPRDERNIMEQLPWTKSWRHFLRGCHIVSDKDNFIIYDETI